MFPENSLGFSSYRFLIIRSRSADLWVLVVLFACILCAVIKMTDSRAPESEFPESTFSRELPR